MKEYLLVFRGGEGKMLKQSPEKWQAHMQKWMDWMGALTAEGKFGGAQPLKNTGKVITGNQKLITDGPFMEGKEMVGGYLICKAADFDEAMKIANDCPILVFDSGIVEVREIEDNMM